jgi:hypothetical protein
MEQKAQLVAMAAVLCQRDEYIFSKNLSSIINEICGGPQLDQFKTKKEAAEGIVKAFQSLDKKQSRKLRKALGDKRFRAKRCLKETIKKIFKRLCLRITVEDLERWATWLEKLVDNFFNPTGVKWVEPIGLVGESAVGKTTSYPLAIYLVLKGFFPTPGKFSDEKLQDFIVNLSLDGKLPLDEWFGDCENIAPEANCDYAYVSIFFAALLLFFFWFFLICCYLFSAM